MVLWTLTLSRKDVGKPKQGAANITNTQNRTSDYLSFPKSFSPVHPTLNHPGAPRDLRVNYETASVCLVHVTGVRPTQVWQPKFKFKFKFICFYLRRLQAFLKRKTTKKNNHPKNNKMKIFKHNQRWHAKLTYKIPFIKNKTNGLHSSFLFFF
jgi:hypothetical protein